MSTLQAAIDAVMAETWSGTTAQLAALERLVTEARKAEAELAALRAENANLKTVMIAAAEEIHAHWDAHCDAEGYGPQNLMRRLEEGIPSEYGYTAGAFAALRAERDALKVDAERYQWLRTNCECLGWGSRSDAAIDAARAGGGNG